MNGAVVAGGRLRSQDLTIGYPGVFDYDDFGEIVFGMYLLGGTYAATTSGQIDMIFARFVTAGPFGLFTVDPSDMRIRWIGDFTTTGFNEIAEEFTDAFDIDEGHMLGIWAPEHGNISTPMVKEHGGSISGGWVEFSNSFEYRPSGGPVEVIDCYSTKPENMFGFSPLYWVSDAPAYTTFDYAVMIYGVGG